MKLFSFVLIGLIAVGGFGFDRTSSGCGLTKTKNGSWIATKSLNLSMWSDSKINHLPSLTKEQIIIATKELVSFRDELTEDRGVKTAVDAIKTLSDLSESNDVVMVYYKVNNRSVTEIRYYPGGNPYGIIFETGSTEILADNEDDTISCR